MVTKVEADGILHDVRVFYKSGEKSSNKKYETSIFDSAELAAKKARRNENREISAGIHNQLRQMYSGYSMYNYGMILYNGGVQVGNCGEMACVAMYVAVSKYHVAMAEVEIWSYRNPTHTAGFLSWAKHGSTLTFGHELLALGPTHATEWLVDPWSDICCAPAAYVDTLSRQLDTWTGQGKRISVSWNTPSGPKGYWTAPSSDDVKAIVSPLSPPARLPPNQPLP